jgi:hypothetical protein
LALPPGVEFKIRPSDQSLDAIMNLGGLAAALDDERD